MYRHSPRVNAIGSVQILMNVKIFSHAVKVVQTLLEALHVPAILVLH